MKTIKYIFNLKPFLVFIASLLIISCSSDDDSSQGPTYTNKPGEASLSLPENNKECEIGEVVDDLAVVDFLWEASSDTEKYNLEITNLITGDITLNVGLTTNTTKVRLVRGYPYSWKVTSRNSGDEVTVSETWKFYLAGDSESNFVPFPVSLISPASGITITPVDGKVTLEWSTSSDADGDDITYTVFADTVDGNQEVPEEWQEITETSIEISVESGTIYFWHVETSDGVNTAISTTYTFRTSD